MDAAKDAKGDAMMEGATVRRWNRLYHWCSCPLLISRFISRIDDTHHAYHAWGNTSLNSTFIRKPAELPLRPWPFCISLSVMGFRTWLSLGVTTRLKVSWQSEAKMGFTR